MYCFFFLMRRRPPRSIRTDTLFPYTTLFRSHVYATTVRKRGVTKPVVTPEEAAREIHAATGRSAYVFGPERSGLETEDVALARKILTVPINPEFGSLNLAQAVILRSEEHTSELQSLMRISYAVFCLKKKNSSLYIHKERLQ